MSHLNDPEVLVLLFPDPVTGGGPSPLVTAFVQDPQGGLALRNLVPDRNLLRQARVAGRYKSGTPILDPSTREIIGYELAPIAVA